VKRSNAFASQQKAVGALTRLNAMAVEHVLKNSDDVTREVVYADEAPRAQMHLVHFNAAARCYENGRYAEGAEICRRIVSATPESCTLLAKCSIQVTDDLNAISFFGRPAGFRMGWHGHVVCS